MTKTPSQELIDDRRRQYCDDALEWRLYVCRLLQQLEIETCEQAMVLYNDGYEEAEPGEDAHQRGLDHAAPFALKAGFDRETVESWVWDTRRGRYAHRPG